MLDPPLTRNGVERIKRTVTFLRESGYKFSRIVTSPLQRAMKVAQLLSDGNIKIYPDDAAKPWNLGDLMGRETRAVKQQLEYLKNYPDIKAPHGESYRNFHQRWSDLLHRIMQYAEAYSTEALVVVTHSRNIDALYSIIRGAPVGDTQNDAPEGSVTKLSSFKTGSGDWSYERIWEGK